MNGLIAENVIIKVFVMNGVIKMGMSIDDSLELFEDNFTVINTHGHYTEEEEMQATEIAINTMKKYQKIQEIATTLEWEKEVSYQSVIAMMNIREVVEDGRT